MEITLKIFRVKEVIAVANVSRTTLWRMVRSGHFPAPVQISEGIKGWPEAQVRDWVNKKQNLAA